MSFKVFIGCALFVASVPTRAAEIRVTREILLEPAHPLVMARMPDGGYVIAGSKDYSAWATRVGSDGTVLWQHEVAGSKATNHMLTEYRGITATKDGAVFLCGQIDDSKSVDRPPPFSHTGEILGLITKISSRGELVSSEKLVAPQANSQQTNRGLNHLDQCALTNEGAVAIGGGAHRNGAINDRRLSGFSWFVTVDRSGHTLLNKTLKVDLSAQGVADIDNLFALSNGDFLAVANSQVAFRFTKQGEVESIGEMALPIRSGEGIALPFRSIGTFSDTNLISLNEDLSLRDSKVVPGGEFQRYAAFSLPNGSIAIFGRTEKFGGTAAAEWRDGNGKLIDTKIFMPTHGAGWIAAVAPTGRADEFATVRFIIPGFHHVNGPDEILNGVMLSFLRFDMTAEPRAR